MLEDFKVLKHLGRFRGHLPGSETLELAFTSSFLRNENLSTSIIDPAIERYCWRIRRRCPNPPRNSFLGGLSDHDEFASSLLKFPGQMMDLIQFSFLSKRY
jgi:hypothetical protein